MRGAASGTLKAIGSYQFSLIRLFLCLFLVALVLGVVRVILDIGYQLVIGISILLILAALTVRGLIWGPPV